MDKPRKTTRMLFRVAAVFTVILALGVRVMGAGWFLILFGLFLLLGAVIHLLVQFAATGRRVRSDRLSGPWLALSDLCFFFGYALQMDGGDAAGCHIGLVNFLGSVAGIITWGDSVWFRMNDICGGFNTFALVLLGVLIATWLIIPALTLRHMPPAPTPRAAPAA